MNDDGSPLDELLLAQRPADSDRFELRAPVVYVDPATGARYRAPAHGETAIAGDGAPGGPGGSGAPGAPGAPGDSSGAPAVEHGVTDLASVPQWLWGFIASYGRQSAAAIVHDERSLLAVELSRTEPDGRRAALLARRDDDRVFRSGLLEQGVPTLRAWLMWAWVSLDRERAFGGALGVLFVVQAVLGAIAVIGAIVAGFWHPLWLLVVLVPVVAALPWGRLAGLQLLLAFGIGVLGPLLVVHLLALVPIRLIEAIVELVAGGRARDVVRPTVQAPYGRLDE